MTTARLCNVLVLLVLSTPATLLAQRGKPRLELAGHALELEHGKPPYGRHSLDELAIGARWRLGSNVASTIRTELPLLGGGDMLPPGDYRVQLYRETKDGFALQVDYAAWALADGREAVYLRSEKLAADEPSEDLEIEWRVDAEASTSPTTSLDLAIRYGPHRIDVPCIAVAAGRPHKLRGYTLVPFAVPVDVVERRQQRNKSTVIASLRPRKPKKSGKTPPFFNLILRGDEIKLVPALRAPVGSFGFAELKPFAPEWTASAPLEWQADQPVQKAAAIDGVKLARRRLTLRFAVGTRAADVALELPRGPR